MKIFIPVLALLSLLSAPVMAQQGMTCVEYTAATTALDDAYGELRVGSGVMESGIAMELFVSENGLTWTMLMHLPNGGACVVGAGQDWEREVPSYKPKPTES